MLLLLLLAAFLSVSRALCRIYSIWLWLRSLAGRSLPVWRSVACVSLARSLSVIHFSRAVFFVCVSRVRCSSVALASENRILFLNQTPLPCTHSTHTSYIRRVKSFFGFCALFFPFDRAAMSHMGAHTAIALGGGPASAATAHARCSCVGHAVSRDARRILALSAGTALACVRFD